MSDVRLEGITKEVRVFNTEYFSPGDAVRVIDSCVPYNALIMRTTEKEIIVLSLSPAAPLGIYSPSTKSIKIDDFIEGTVRIVKMEVP
jgi:hypothetical protein